MVLSKIKGRVASSKLLFQQNFDRASDDRPFEAHCKAIIAALGFLLFAVIVVGILPVVGLVRSDYWAAQSLLNRGLTTVGTIESFDDKPRRVGRSSYIMTVDYRFVGPDGQVYRGSLTYQGAKPPRVAIGDSIEILHDPHRPTISGWRTALQGTIIGVDSFVFVALLFLPWCVLWLYRYVRWRQHRRSLPT